MPMAFVLRTGKPEWLPLQYQINLCSDKLLFTFPTQTKKEGL